MSRGASVYVAFALRSFAPAKELEKTAGAFGAIVERLALNQTALRQFSWRMHTEVSVNGRITKIADDLCRYGPDGTVYKTPVGTPTPRDSAPGLRRRKIEAKPDEIQGSMDAAILLTRDY